MGSRLLKAGSLLLLASFIAGNALANSGSIPEVLVIQRRVEKSKQDDPNLEVGDYVAQELQDDGRVSPVYWSETDAIFRSMLKSGKAPSSETPSLETALSVAKVMKFTYVLVVEAHLSRDGAVLSRAELLRGDTVIWEDPDAKSLGHEFNEKDIKSGVISRLEVDRINESKGYRRFTVSGTTGTDTTNTLRSLARTWVALLGSGPLSGLLARPEHQTPDPIAGPIQRLAETVPQLPKPADNAQVFQDVDAAVKENRKDLAIIVLHKAIDEAPFDMARRQALIKLLNDTGHPELAAIEAATAARLSPNTGGFRLESARSQLAAGNLDGAQATAKDALARDPKNPDGHLILGEVSLQRLDFPVALEEINAAVDLEPTAEMLYYRALTKIFLGDVKGAQSDTSSAQHGAALQPVPGYNETMPILDGGCTSAFNALRDLRPQVTIGNSSADLVPAVTKIEGEATGAIAFLGAWPVPPSHASSHERRLLALKLLAQSASEVLAYLGNRDDASLTDAWIDLGEAMKQYKAAKELFGAEAKS